MKSNDIKKYPLYEVDAMSDYIRSNLSELLGINFIPENFECQDKYTYMKTRKFSRFQKNENYQGGIHIFRIDPTDQQKKENIVRFNVFFKFKLEISNKKLIPSSFEINPHHKFLKTTIEKSTPYARIAEVIGSNDGRDLWLTSSQEFFIKNNCSKPLSIDDEITYLIMFDNKDIDFYSFFSLSFMTDISYHVKDFLKRNNIEFTGLDNSVETIDKLCDIVSMVKI